MPIEFRCPQCDRLLRTPDNSAGKQAKCPQCGNIATVPLGGSSNTGPQSGSDNTAPQGGLPDLSGGALAGLGNLPPFPASGLPGDAPGGGLPGFDPLGRPTGGDNPYQTPSFSPQYGSMYGSGTGRTGPAWEREGPSFGSFVNTVKECVGDVLKFYGTMRRADGVGRPLGFALAGGMLGVTVLFALQLVMQMALMGLAVNAGADGTEQVVGMLAGLGCGFLMAPFVMAIWLFIQAGICHLMLMMLGGANYPYEATFRVVAYSYGVSSLILLIPFCGQYISLVVQIVFCCIGLTQMHETTGVKATAAVLLPVLLCIGATIGLVVAIVFMGVNLQ